MGFTMFVGLSVAICFAVLVTVIVCTLVVTFVCGSIGYSRLALALGAALVINVNGGVILEHQGFLNFLAWAAVVYAGLYLVCLFRRAGGAIRGFSTLFMSFMAVDIVLMFAFAIISSLFGLELEVNAVMEIIIKAVCCFFAVGAAAPVEGETIAIELNNPILAAIERGISSLIYGICAVFLIFSINGNWNLPEGIGLVILALAAAGAYILDMTMVPASAEV